MTTLERMLRLEELVDEKSLHAVVIALANVCYSKSAHIDEQWQDAALAALWYSVARELDNLSLEIEKRRL